MMNKLKLGVVLAVGLVAAPVVNAATVATIVANSTNGAGNTAGVAYAIGYGDNTPAGALWSSDPTVVVPPGNLSGVYQSPFNNTGLVGTQNYFSVGAENGPNGAPSPVTLTFGAAVRAFDILWGSIDSYNTISFSNATSFTGVDIANLFPIAPGPANYEKVALVHFAFDEDVTSVTFASSQAAFEFALAPVPVPAAGFLLVGALGGLAALRRRKAKTA